MGKIDFVAASVLFALLSSGAQAGLVGSYQSVRHGIGFVDLDRSSTTYRGLPGLKSPKSGAPDLRTPSRQLDETWLTRDGKLDLAAVDAERARLRDSERAAFILSCSQSKVEVKTADCGAIFDAHDPKHPLWVKWKTKRLVVGWRFAQAELERARVMGESLAAAGINLREREQANTDKAHELYAALFGALEVEEAIRSEDYVFGSMTGFYGKMLETKASITIRGDRPEALNLLPPPPFAASSRYVDPARLRASGIDLSRLDPEDSGLWRRPRKPIAEFDTTRYDGLASSPKADQLADPSREIDLEFSKASSNGKTPKFQAVIGGQLAKVKFNLPGEDVSGATSLWDTWARFTSGSEVYTETAVNNLAAALGFTIDPTWFKKSVRVYFPKDGFDAAAMNSEATRIPYEQRFEKERLAMIAAIAQSRSGDPSPAFADIGVDEKGRRFVRMKDVSIEFYSAEGQDTYLGLFTKEGYGRAAKREHRALQLFLAWVNDWDSKDGNGDIKLAPVSTEDGRTEYRIVFSESDMGATLGSMSGKDQPNSFAADLVAKSSPDEVVLSFKTRNRNPIYDAITLNDARWFARLLGQLTAAQIRGAMIASGHPEVIAELFTQKLLRRRDQLVSALGLSAEIPADSSAMKDPATYAVPGFESMFKGGKLILAEKGRDNPVKMAVEGHPLAAWAEPRDEDFNRALGANLASLGLKPLGTKLQTFSVKGAFIGGVRAGLNTFVPARYIMPNPFPSEEAPWWVVDVFRVGAEGGFANYIRDTGKKIDVDADVARVLETIRVRPTRDPLKALSQYAQVFDPREALGTPFRKLQIQQIESLEPGDAILTNSYRVVGGAVTANLGVAPMATPWFSFGPYARIGVKVELEHATSAIRLEDGTALVSRLDGRGHTFDFEGGIAGPFTQFPIFMEQISHETSREWSAVYALSDAAQREKLTTLLAGAPTDVLETSQGQTAERVEKSVGVHRRILSLFGFTDHERKKESVAAAHYSAGATEPDAQVRSNIRSRINSDYIHNQVYIRSIQATSTDVPAKADASDYVRLDLSYVRAFATRDDLLWLKNRALGFFPSSLLAFDPQQAAYYLGTLSLEGSLVLSPKAVDSIAAKAHELSVSSASLADACSQFAAHLPYSLNSTEGKSWCGLASELGSAQDLNRFAASRTRTPEDAERLRAGIEAVRSFTGWLRKLGRARGTDASKQLALWIDKSPMPQPLMETLLAWTEGSEVRRTAEMRSSLGGFPGQEEVIAVNPRERGAYAGKADALHEVESRLLGARVRSVLRPLFFDYLKERRNVGMVIDFK